jgi:hypothetical protein
MSTDSDLEPALEAVVRFDGKPYPHCEVAAWSYLARRHSPRISIRDKRVWCHWLRADDYQAVADPTDYRVARGTAPAAQGVRGAAGG